MDAKKLLETPTMEFWGANSFKVSNQVCLGIFDLGLETWVWNPQARDEFGGTPPVPMIVAGGKELTIDEHVVRLVGDQEAAEVLAQILGHVS